ncbi:8045_t:CDS:2 [Gigaspora rosea]|nr:8045_t:CDS:2 [Gigaspora rosea]
MGQLGQVFSRLFPFKRGLCHAYWAPNFWALYSFMDRILIIVFRQLGWVLNDTATSSVTRGLVGDVSFAVLPQIPAKTTFIITVVFQMASLAKLWRYPNFKNFIGSTILCGYSSFLFGWHVHEKAVLLIMIPFGLIATESLEHFRTFVILSISGLFSLFPLLFKSTGFKSESKTTPKPVKSTFVYLLENVYIVGFVILQFFTGVVHQIAFSDGKFQFLPLLATSTWLIPLMIYLTIGLLKDSSSVRLPMLIYSVHVSTTTFECLSELFFGDHEGLLKSQRNLLLINEQMFISLVFSRDYKWFHGVGSY